MLGPSSLQQELACLKVDYSPLCLITESVCPHPFCPDDGTVLIAQHVLYGSHRFELTCKVRITKRS